MTAHFGIDPGSGSAPADHAPDVDAVHRQRRQRAAVPIGGAEEWRPFRPEKLKVISAISARSRRTTTVETSMLSSSRRACAAANSLTIVDPAHAFGRPIVVPALVADVGPRAQARWYAARVLSLALATAPASCRA
jgi:hypothetical protein